MNGRKVAVLIGLGVAGPMLLGSPASAHAAYKDSDPPDESTVASPPSSVWAEFTEPVTMDSSLSVTDPCGARVDNGDSRVTGARITISMEGRAAGTYTVSFSVISAVDGHPTRGSFTFTSTGGDPCPGAEEPSEEPPEEPREEPGEESTSRAPRNEGASGSETSTTPGSSPGAPAGKDSGGARNPKAVRTRDGVATAGREKGAGDLAPVVAATPELTGMAAEEPGVWDLPMDGFIAALLVAAAIGAVGGRIYVGIVSPDS